MQVTVYSLIPVYYCLTLVAANVEKIIFIAPEAINIPQKQPNILNVHVESVNPKTPSLRRELPAAFPSPDYPEGIEAWFLLDGLRQYQRYEVRICWAATVRDVLQRQHCLHIFFNHVSPNPQYIAKNSLRYIQQPTSFVLGTFTLPEVSDHPALNESLTTFSLAQQSAINSRVSKAPKAAPRDEIVSALFLRITAAADYFSANETLMENVPPVNVDISKGHISKAK